MTKISVLPFSPTDLRSIELREHERVVLKIDKLALVLHECISVTMWAHDDTADEMVPLAILAYLQIAEGLLEVFLIPSVYLPGYAFPVVRTAIQYLDRLEQDIPNFRRMESRSLANAQTDKWMIALGFTKEGVHPKYAPDGSTYNSWARIA